MDTLCSTVSTLTVPTNREFYQFKRTPPYATPNRPPPPHTPSIIPKSANPNFSHTSSSCTSLPLISSSKTNSPLQQQSSPILHSKPATGYAAAMVDVAQSTNSLHSVHRDVQRLLRLLFLLHPADAEVKGERAVRHVAEKQGRFHRHVVALLKVLLKKKKLGIVQQVLQEFERIYHQLCGEMMMMNSLG